MYLLQKDKEHVYACWNRRIRQAGHHQEEEEVEMVDYGDRKLNVAHRSRKEKIGMPGV
ncbi:hypothetical protein BDQ12DRAFT_673196, partial [Crucibulum laeve]